MKYDNGFDAGWDCITTVCPECHEPSIKISKASSTTGAPLVDMVSKALVKEQWVYPTSRRGKRFGHEVPDDFKNDYLDACEVLLVSPRSSATLSRRILEAVLREQDYRQDTIAKQIDAVRNETVPDKKLPTVKGGVILGHGVSMASISVLLNWPARMSHYGECDIDAEGAGKATGPQQLAGRAHDCGAGGHVDGSEHTPHQAYPGGLQGGGSSRTRSRSSWTPSTQRDARVAEVRGAAPCAVPLLREPITLT